MKPLTYIHIESNHLPSIMKQVIIALENGDYHPATTYSIKQYDTINKRLKNVVHEQINLQHETN